MIVGLCGTQIGDNPPILTKKLTKTKTKKSLKKSADFFGPDKSADFVVGGEIVWWDTSLSLKVIDLCISNTIKTTIISQFQLVCHQHIGDHSLMER